MKWHKSIKVTQHLLFPFSRIHLESRGTPQHGSLVLRSTKVQESGRGFTQLRWPWRTLPTGRRGVQGSSTGSSCCCCEHFWVSLYVTSFINDVTRLLWPSWEILRWEMNDSFWMQRKHFCRHTPPSNHPTNFWLFDVQHVQHFLEGITLLYLEDWEYLSCSFPSPISVCFEDAQV